MSDKAVTDLDQLVKDWAVANADKLGIRNAKKARVEVVWDRVTFTPDEAGWKKVAGVPQPPNRTIYSSSFSNRTAEKAEHHLKVERSSKSTVSTSVSSGYTRSGSVSLSLSLPQQVASVTAGYGRSVEISGTEETTREETQTWSVDTAISAPPRTLTRVRMEVNWGV